ncbi:MAG: ligase-associated DNA damage response endonuclease PdeM [Rhodobacteraceae bacterium]|nr:ligase-associated DNA damage response endonuclease PdeM [Paracoccaceae bacterium]
MNGHEFSLLGVKLTALPSGALWWPGERILTVSDLHLGKAERIARQGGAFLPPYEVRDTLSRLDLDIGRTGATTVICLGDSFDDLLSAEALPEDERLWLTRLMAGRRWIWIAGNHDPAPVDFGGSNMAEFGSGRLTFRHIAQQHATGEVSGHFHPKARLNLGGKVISRPCFLYDAHRVILPAYGTYTGGLRSDAPELTGLMQRSAIAVMTGEAARALPMPRG